MLELKGIHKYYNPGTVNEMCLFQNFNLTIDNGEFVSVVGSNGSGKTSMLNIICGSIPVEGGQILINGSDITKQKEFKRNQRIGRVYQNPAMGTCPSMTILENMSLADNKGKVFGLSRGTNKSRIEYYREQLSQLGLGLEDKMDVKVGALSGGQRQAMALLMSTMTPIDFLILDEPTAGLDPQGRDDILDQIAALHKMRGITIILVSHSMEDIAKYVERLIVMNHGEMVFDDTPKNVFSHYKELEEMGLAAPQITYIMHALSENGLNVDTTATTVEEARDTILEALKKQKPSLLKKGGRSE